MSELKATPGPWFVHPSGASIRTSARHEIYTYPHIIARLPYATQRVANAHLIAAAPALYEALEAMIHHSCVADSAPEDKDGEDHIAESNALRALKQARGEA